MRRLVTNNNSFTFSHLLFAVISLTANLLMANPTCQTAGCHTELGKAKFIHGPMKAHGCKVCHQVIGNTEKHPIFEKTNAAAINKACFVCHDEMSTLTTNSHSVHKVISEKACTSCHDPHQSEHKHLLKESGQLNLCVKCHEAQSKIHSRHALKEMKEGCLSCHQPHSSKEAHLLKKSERATCLACHAEKVKGISQDILAITSWTTLPDSSVHKPIVKGECGKCHEVHGSETKYLLRSGYSKDLYVKNLKDDLALCFQCHKEALFKNKEATTETQFRNGKQNLHQFHVVGGKKIRNCMVCHDPHASSQGSLIRASFAYPPLKVPLEFKKTTNGGTCATACHRAVEYNRIKAVTNERDP